MLYRIPLFRFTQPLQSRNVYLYNTNQRNTLHFLHPRRVLCKTGERVGLSKHNCRSTVFIGLIMMTCCQAKILHLNVCSTCRTTWSKSCKRPERYKTSRTEENAPSKTNTYTGTPIQSYQRTKREDPTRNCVTSPC
jgi:hypothetical protein